MFFRGIKFVNIEIEPIFIFFVFHNVVNCQEYVLSIRTYLYFRELEFSVLAINFLYILCMQNFVHPKQVRRLLKESM